MSSYESFAGSYDILTGNVDYQKRGEYFHNIFLQYGKKSGILVDLACGTGSLSEFFARLNYDVIGVDASEEMLVQAWEKKYESQSDIVYLHQRMQELDLFGTVDIVLCALDSLNHITDAEELAGIFERIALFLNQDALFVFDLNTIYKHQTVLANHTFVYDYDEVYCVWQNNLLEDGLVEITLDLFEYDEETDGYFRSQECFCERAYPHEQILSFLDRAGFDLLACYGDDSFQKPIETTERVIYIAKNRVCKNALPQTEINDRTGNN